MLRNTEVKEGFRRSKYPETRKPRKPIKYQHISDPAGRTFLLIVAFTGEEMTGHSPAHIIDRNFKAAGLNANRLFETVTRLAPDYVAYYAKKSGRVLTKDVVYDRWHKKAAYSNGPTGTRGQSRPAPSHEHYLYSKRLRACVPKVEAAFRAGVPLTLAQMQELGAIDA